MKTLKLFLALLRAPRVLLIILGIGRSGREFYAGKEQFDAGKLRARVVANTRGPHRRRLLAETEGEIAVRPPHYEAGFRSELRELEGRK